MNPEQVDVMNASDSDMKAAFNLLGQVMTEVALLDKRFSELEERIETLEDRLEIHIHG